MRIALSFIGILFSSIIFAQNMHEKHKPIKWDAVFSNDLKYLSTNGSDGYGYIWDLQKGEAIDKITPEDGKNAQIFISQDGVLKAIRSNGKIKVYSLADNQLKHEFSDETIQTILGISTNGHKIIALASTSTYSQHNIISINIDGTGTQELIKIYSVYNGAYKNVNYSPNDLYRITSDKNYIIYYIPDYKNYKYGKSYQLDVITKKIKTITGKASNELEDVFGAGANHFVGRIKGSGVELFDSKGMPSSIKIKNGRALANYVNINTNMNVDFSNDEKYVLVTFYRKNQNLVSEKLTEGSYYAILFDGELSKEVLPVGKDINLGDGRWSLPSIAEDKQSFAILYQDYKRQGAAVGFYDAKTAKEIKIIYLQNGPAYFSYYDEQAEKEKAFQAEKKKKEAEELAKKFHCVGYKIVKSTDPKYDITIFYTGIVSFKTERKQSDIQPGVTCKCGDKTKLQEEIQILENTAKQKKGILILDTSLISNSEIFRDK